MAKIVFGEALANYAWIGDFYKWELTLTSSSNTAAVFEDSTGSTIVFGGTNLTFFEGELVGGKVDSVDLVSDGGATLVAVTEGRYSAKDLKAVDLWAFLTALTAGNDRLIGNDEGTDLNLGNNHGDDSVMAGDGGSYMAGSEGRDTYKGGEDWDTLSYKDAYWQDDVKRGVQIDAEKGTATDGWGDKDKFTGIEEFQGSHLSDRIVGSKRGEAFSGMAGRDVIDGGKGWDDLRYHRDANFEGGDQGIVVNLAKGTVRDGFGDIDKVKNIEAVYGTQFDDSFAGGSKDDFFSGIDGTDSYDGKGGDDTVSFYWWEDIGQAGATVDLTLSANQVADDGFGNVETLISIENIEGSGFADTIKLGASGGRIWGQDGDDTLTAAQAGTSFLTGDGGEDTFVFESAVAIGMKGVDHDIIEDFTNGEDKIDLSAIDGLNFVGTDAFGATGAAELRYEQTNDGTFVLGDTDGNGEADFAIEFRGDADFTAADFIL